MGVPLRYREQVAMVIKPSDGAALGGTEVGAMLTPLPRDVLLTALLVRTITTIRTVRIPRRQVGMKSWRLRAMVTEVPPAHIRPP